METHIDSMKYRKSTHLAGIDVESFCLEKGNCILTIKKAFYDINVDVSGNKTNGYFLEFEEDVKNMVVNSGNRKVINEIVKQEKSLPSPENRQINNWAGIKIDLFFDPTVKMMGAVTGGIKVKPVVKIQISDKNAIEFLSKSKTIDELKINWNLLKQDERELPTVLALKENLKTSLK